MPPVVFAPEVAGREMALVVDMEEEVKARYKRDKASLVGYQGAFTKKETSWGAALDAWTDDPMSATHKEATEECRLAMKEAKSRLDTAIYGVIAFGVVPEHYENFMDELDARYQLMNKRFLQLSASFRDNLKAEEEQKLQRIKEERAEVKKERDERLLELEAREKVDDNRNTRKTGLIELELRAIRERRAQEQAARDNPVPALVPPVHAPPHVPAAPAADPALYRRYREVQSLHPGILGLNQSPEELRTFQNSFRNWYEISCLDTLPIPQQIFSLKKCCDLALQQKLTWDIFPDIEAALLSLTQAWVNEYPIVVRRLEYLRNKQMQSEDDEEFVLRATQLYLNADIATMTPVQLQKLNIISGLRDSKLQVKLLELPAGATMADLNTARHTYTANIATSEKLGGATSEHRAQKVAMDSSQTCWKCGKNGHIRFDCRAKNLYCAKCKISDSHVTSTCRDNERGRSSSRGRDNSRSRNTSRGRDRQRNDSRRRNDSRGQTPRRRDRSDSRRRSDSRNDNHRARSVEHKETLGHEIANRVTTKGTETDVDDDYDREVDDGFTEGHFDENCYQLTEFNDDDSEESDADESTFTDIILADEFTEGNYRGDSATDDDDEMVESVHMGNSNNDEDITAEAHAQLLNDDENNAQLLNDDDNNETMMNAEETNFHDENIDDVEYYWSDDDEAEDPGTNDADSEVMISLMTTSRQDMSVILSETETRRQREEIFPSLCSSCRNIAKYFPLSEADTGMLFPTKSDIGTQTDTDYFDRQKYDSQSRHEMSEFARGNRNDIFLHGARENHFCYQLSSRNQTPTVQMDFSTKPNSRTSFSIHSCPDTGATKSIIRAGIVRDKKLQLLPSGDSSLRDAQGVYMKVEGKVRIYVSIRGGKNS